MAHHRLFVAIRPPRAAREELLDLMGGIPGARWQDDAQLHLTLRFIGEVDRHVAADVAAALGGVRQQGFWLTAASVGRFERKGHGGAVWVGIIHSRDLVELQKKIGRALAGVGIALEQRAFAPHITLARLSRGAGPAEPFLARHAGLAGAPFPVEAFTLFESTLAAEGAFYAPVERYRLGLGQLMPA